MKTCTKCNIEKEVSEFYKDSAGKDGYRTVCTACTQARHAERRRERRAGIVAIKVQKKECNKCKIIKPSDEYFKDAASGDGLYSICKECKTKSTMNWRNNNKEHYNNYMREKNKEFYPIDRLRRYNLTLEQYKALLEHQGHVCAMCKQPPNGTRPLAVDHDHKTDIVRGLLCYGCNRLLHIFDYDKLNMAMEYLNNPPAKNVIKI